MDNFQLGIIKNWKDRCKLEQWFQDIYDKFCKDRKRGRGCHHNVIVYDYNTGEIMFGPFKRKEILAQECAAYSRGFIAYFYKDKIYTIERRELI